MRRTFHGYSSTSGTRKSSPSEEAMRVDLPPAEGSRRLAQRTGRLLLPELPERVPAAGNVPQASRPSIGHRQKHRRPGGPVLTEAGLLDLTSIPQEPPEGWFQKKKEARPSQALATRVIPRGRSTSRDRTAGCPCSRSAAWTLYRPLRPDRMDPEERTRSFVPVPCPARTGRACRRCWRPSRTPDSSGVTTARGARSWPTWTGWRTSGTGRSPPRCHAQSPMGRASRRSDGHDPDNGFGIRRAVLRPMQPQFPRQRSLRPVDETTRRVQPG